MSGVEALGIVSSIISILDAAVNLVKAYHDFNGLPAAVREAHNRLPLVKDTLELLKKGLSDAPDNESHRLLFDYMNSCLDKAAELEDIFKTIIPVGKAKSSVRKRFTTAAFMTLHIRKSRKIESLMRGILDDISLLADNRALNETIGKHIRASTKAIQLGQQPPAAPVAVTAYLQQKDCRVQHQGHRSTINNHGPGVQYIHSGSGAQNVNTGNGQFFMGDFSTPFYFGTTVAR